MIATWLKPLPSSAERIAPPPPSIMSDGATISAPARACDSAERVSSSSVASLSTSLPASAPQWPWSVYSHMQTSVITAIPGTRSLISRIARCTSPSSFHASLPLASLRSGIPNRMTAGTPAAHVSRASATMLSTDICATPGIDLIAFFTPRPGHTNIGRIRSSANKRVSRIMRRIVSVRRSRRGRLIGKGIVVLGVDYICRFAHVPTPLPSGEDAPPARVRAPALRWMRAPSPDARGLAPTSPEGRGNSARGQFRFDVRLVVRTHRAERAHLMIGEFVVGVAMLGAEDASDARVASRGAVRLYFDAMRQAFRDVPSRFDAHCACRACWDAGARGATGTWVEAERVAGRIEFLVEQQRGAKCDPRSIQWMHRDAEDAGAGDARDFAK